MHENGTTSNIATASLIISCVRLTLHHACVPTISLVRYVVHHELSLATFLFFLRNLIVCQALLMILTVSKFMQTKRGVISANFDHQE
jgi:hypothetical protein